MSDPRSKSPKQEYAELKAELEDLESKDILKVEPTGKKSLDNIRLRVEKRIQEINARMNELEPDKDKTVLGKTCISFLDEWVKEQYYGRKRTLTIDQVQKGREVEVESIMLLNKVTGKKYKQDGKFLENEFMTGHRDIFDEEEKIIRDEKNCYSIDTFPFVIQKKLEIEYEWQMQGYFILSGPEYKQGYVDRVLINTPPWIIEKEIYYIFNNLKRMYPSDDLAPYVDEQVDILARELFLRHVFDQKLSINANGTILKLEPHEVIPEEKRIYTLPVKRRNVEKEIEERVLECRNYLKQNGY